MNSLIILPDECEGHDRAVLRGARADYAFHTHEVRAGASVKGGVLGRGMGRVHVESASPEEIVLRVTVEQPSLTPHAIDLIVGVSRPQTIKKVIQAAAMLGVRSLTFVGSELGEKSYLQSHVLMPHAIQEEVVKALEQIADTYVPCISVHQALWRYVREEASTLSTKRCLVAHPGGRSLLREFMSDNVAGTGSGAESGAQRESSGGVVLAIGPEKGWSEGEVALLLRNGFQMAGLGERVVRVELAVVAAVAQVVVLQEMWGNTAKLPVGRACLSVSLSCS